MREITSDQVSDWLGSPLVQHAAQSAGFVPGEHDVLVLLEAVRDTMQAFEERFPDQTFSEVVNQSDRETFYNNVSDYKVALESDIRAGLTAREIADKYSITKHTVFEHKKKLKQCGDDPVLLAKFRAGSSREPGASVIDGKVVRAGLEAGQSIRGIAAANGWKYATVHSYMRRSGLVKPRPRSVPA